MEDFQINYGEIWKRNQARQVRPDLASELAFWERAAATYDTTNSLAQEAPQLVERLLTLVGEVGASSILEIGAGTGEFTLPLARSVQEITALDQSPAMLQVLAAKLAAAGLDNCKILQSLWEDYPAEASAEKKQLDCIVAVNALYRVPDLLAALLKINLLAGKRAILVRSIEGPPTPPPAFLQEFGGRYQIRPGDSDYLQLVGGLYQLGIHANLEIHSVTRARYYSSLEELEQVMWSWFKLPQEPTPLEKERGRELLQEAVQITPKGLLYPQTHPVAIIHWRPTA